MSSTKECFKGTFELLTSRVCLVPLIVGVLSGSLGAALHVVDKQHGGNLLRRYVPDDVVFNVFVVFGGLVAGFRTAHALSRYTDAAAFLHKLNACWYDAASTLIAFCRNSKAPHADIKNFQHTLVRLMSIQSALCLDGLQQRDGNGVGYRFEVVGAEELDDETQACISESQHKVECVFQMIQQVVVDAIDTKVLSIAPPILSRSFQEMGAGLLTYHEAKKLACVPLPKAYLFFTATILSCEALFVPWMIAIYTRGAFSTFFYTFSGVFLLWFLNFVANSLDNPFQKEARTLEASKVQHELNLHLLQMLSQAQQPAPYTEMSRSSLAAPKRSSFHSWQNEASTSSTRRASTMPVQESVGAQGSSNSNGSGTRKPRGQSSSDEKKRETGLPPRLSGNWDTVGAAPPVIIATTSATGRSRTPPVTASQCLRCSNPGASPSGGGPAAPCSCGRELGADTDQPAPCTPVPASPPRRTAAPGTRAMGNQPEPSPQPAMSGDGGSASPFPQPVG